jgi:dsRNA-specific ribonuclease
MNYPCLDRGHSAGTGARRWFRLSTRSDAGPIRLLNLPRSSVLADVFEALVHGARLHAKFHTYNAIQKIIEYTW